MHSPSEVAASLSKERAEEKGLNGVDDSVVVVSELRDGSITFMAGRECDSDML